AAAACAAGGIAQDTEKASVDRTAATTARTRPAVPTRPVSQQRADLRQQRLGHELVEFVEAPWRAGAMVAPVDRAFDLVAVPDAHRAARSVEHLAGHAVGRVGAEPCDDRSHVL